MRIHPLWNLPPLICVLAAGLGAQSTQTNTAVTTVPRLVRISNTFHPANGLSAAPVESVTFSIYSEQTGGTPLWQETQNVNVDAEGHYTALLGATQNDGVPLELFSSAEPRWLGVQFNRPGETEQPRVRLASVPYALKAADAETLGGLPAAAYLRSPNFTSFSSGSTGSSEAGDGSGPVSLPDARALKPHSVLGNLNYLPYISDASLDLNNSVLYQNGSGGALGLGTQNPTPVNASTIVPKLVLTGTGTAQGIQMVRTTNPGVGGAQIILSSTRGSDANTYAALEENDGIGIFSFNGTDGGQFVPAAGIYAQVDGAVGPSNVPGRLLFTTSAGGANNLVERMRITSGGNVGIGTTTPGATLEVNGNTQVDGNLSVAGAVNFANFQSTSSAANGAAVSGQNTATTGYPVGVQGNVTGTVGAGVNGNASQGGAVGVNGFNSATTGFGTGVLGGTNSPGGSGVYGVSNTTTGNADGVIGVANSPNANGVIGINNSTSGGVGVSGSTAGSSGAGVAGNVSQTGAIGVTGFNSATSGFAVGVYGSTNSNTGVGVNGFNGYTGTASGAYPVGVQGGVNGTLGSGVQGNAQQAGASGVTGYNSGTSGFAIGVNGGTNSPNGAGVFGSNNATTGNGGAGVQGNANIAGNYGLAGYNGATSGYAVGVQGNANSPNGGAGVRGGTGSANAVGVQGNNVASSGYAVGVSGASNSTGGAAVQGNAGNGAYGVVGNAFGTSGFAVGTQGISSSPGAVSVQGISMTCPSTGCAYVAGTAGQFQAATTGLLLQGMSGAAGAALSTGTQVFSVDGTGRGKFANGVQGASNTVLPDGNPGVVGFASATSGVTFTRSASL